MEENKNSEVTGEVKENTSEEVPIAKEEVPIAKEEAPVAKEEAPVVKKEENRDRPRQPYTGRRDFRRAPGSSDYKPRTYRPKGVDEAVDKESYQKNGGGGDHRIPKFKKKVCRFCYEKELKVDYKNVEMLGRFITDRGKILPRRVTGTCSKHQRAIAREIKRARLLSLMPFIEK